jgi:hypothetical protein
MGLGLGSWLGLDVVAKLHGLLCSCFFQDFSPCAECSMASKCAIIAFIQCPPSIEEAAKIKSPNLFQVENNKLCRNVKGLFLSVRFVSSQVIIVMSWLGCRSRTSCLSCRGGVRGVCCHAGQQIHP